MVLCILSSACNSTLSDRVIPTTSPTVSIEQTNTPVIEKTPTIVLTASITPSVITKPKLNDLALNENNIDRLENLATFGTTRENCLISSYQDAAIETRFVNGQAKYLLALMNLDKNLEIQNIQLWDLATEKNIQTFNSNEIDSVLFHPDNRTLISFSRYEPGKLTLWDIQNGNQRQEFYFESNHWYDEHISISPDGSRIAFFHVLLTQ